MHREKPAPAPPPARKPVRIVIVEDQTLFAALLTEILSAQPDFLVVGSAGTSAAAEALLAKAAADVVILDLTLPDRGGLELLQALNRAGSRTRVVVCSAAIHPAAIATAYGLGAHAFIEKTGGIHELIDTLRRAARGEYCLPPRAAEVLSQHAQGSSGPGLLQPGDLGVLRRLARHEPVRQIAAEVGLSASGVYKVRRRIARRTGARTKRELYQLAVGLGLVTGTGGPADDGSSPRRPAAGAAGKD